MKTTIKISNSQRPMFKAIQEVIGQINYEDEMLKRDLPDRTEWTADYAEGYIDGMERAVELIVEQMWPGFRLVQTEDENGESIILIVSER